MMGFAGPILGMALAVAPASSGMGAQAAGASPPVAGTVSVEVQPPPADGADAQAFLLAASAALADRGFTVLPGAGHAAFAATIVIDRAEVGTATARVAGQGAAAVAGAGVVVPLSTGRSDLVPLRRTRLDIWLWSRSAGRIVWHGGAVTIRAASTRQGSDEAVAADLSRAALASYPVVAPDIGVP